MSSYVLKIGGKYVGQNGRLVRLINHARVYGFSDASFIADALCCRLIRVDVSEITTRKVRIYPPLNGRRMNQSSVDDYVDELLLDAPHDNG